MNAPFVDGRVETMKEDDIDREIPKSHEWL